MSFGQPPRDSFVTNNRVSNILATQRLVTNSVSSAMTDIVDSGGGSSVVPTVGVATIVRQATATAYPISQDVPIAFSSPPIATDANFYSESSTTGIEILQDGVHEVTINSIASAFTGAPTLQLKVDGVATGYVITVDALVKSARFVLPLVAGNVLTLGLVTDGSSTYDATIDTSLIVVFINSTVGGA